MLHDRYTRKYYLALSLAIYDDMPTWTKEIRKTNLYKATREQLYDYCKEIYNGYQKNMLPNVYKTWIIRIERDALRRLIK